MKNWIIVLLIFVIPLGLYAYLESNANDALLAKNTQVEKPGKPRLFKFTSPLCSDCKKVNKEIITIVPDYKDSVTYEEINVNEQTAKNKEIIQRYKITVVPTLVFVDKNGKIVKKTEGFITKEEIKENLENIK